ncbi:MAG: ATP-binding cassette domain-containing protein [Gammaproteobacteria bacterium]|nr:ATP-binding cassette domain-containing protein [Gammaproteobacteria bacterium]
MSLIYQLNNIQYIYTTTPVLRIDEYSIEEHSVTALVGANGSGKSTLLNMLAFITEPTAGELIYAGEKMSSAHSTDCRRETAYVQQKPYLFNFSVRQNIELGLKLRGINKRLRRHSSDKIAEKLNLSKLLGRRAHELSGGELQKVAIARALILEPRVLLLDEPFSHLDKNSRIDIENLLKSLTASAAQTIIFSTHDVLQAQSLATQVCSLNQGRIGSSLHVNTFKGDLDVIAGVFKTSRLDIHVPPLFEAGSQLAIDSTQLVLSRERLKSSMRNQFQGRVVGLQELGGEVNISVDAGEIWQAIITHEALNDLQIEIGAEIWLSFKSSAVQVF